MSEVKKPGKAVKSGTTVKPCSCASEYQDRRYGKGNRVFNLSAKAATCTVCGKQQ
jgi:hypothetical protein